MIEAFLLHELSPLEFRKRFYDAFAAETLETEMSFPVFQILEDLFEDLDAYTPVWPPTPGLIHVISEDELRAEAQTAVDALRQLK
jgi:hypothetical protein